MKLSAIFLTLFFLPIVSFAHTEGTSFEAVVDGYLIDIGYSGDVAQELIRYDLSITDPKTLEDLPFTTAWIRISEEKKTLFAGSIARGQFGVPGFSIVFPQAGTYDLFVRFENEKGALVERTIPVIIKGNIGISGDSEGTYPVVGGIIALVAGFVLGFLIKRK